MFPANQTITFKNQAIVFSKVCLKTENLWMIWATKKLPNPLAAMKSLEGLPSDVAKEIAIMAYKDFKRGWSIADPEVTALRQTPEGFTQSIVVLLMVGNNWTEEKATEVYEQLLDDDDYGMKKISEVVVACAGGVPSFLSLEAEAPTTQTT